MYNTPSDILIIQRSHMHYICIIQVAHFLMYHIVAVGGCKGYHALLHTSSAPQTTTIYLSSCLCTHVPMVIVNVHVRMT